MVFAIRFVQQLPGFGERHFRVLADTGYRTGVRQQYRYDECRGERDYRDSPKAGVGEEASGVGES
jgi:hypothetical protein